MLALSLCAAPAGAIVIRHDVDDAQYRVAAADFPALADLPGEGHGVLIAPQWVLTAAHAVTWQSQVRQVTIQGQPRDVARVVVHPGYQKPPQTLTDQALATWDWTLFRMVLAATSDVALVQLAQPVTDVAPVPLNQETDEYGKLVQIVGKGATGTGLRGYEFHDPHRTELRRAFNRVSSAHGGWFCYAFDKAPEALPLEGGSGSGDSGGPVLVQSDRGWLLAGLTSWVDPQSTSRKPGQYGQITCNVRVSHHRPWIESVMNSRP
jgi:hypothetical protein